MLVKKLQMRLEKKLKKLLVKKWHALISEIENVTGQAIDDAVEAELAAAINEAITYAVQQGVSEAAAEAAIAAMLWVYANGGSDEEAMDVEHMPEMRVN